MGGYEAMKASEYVISPPHKSEQKQKRIYLYNMFLCIIQHLKIISFYLGLLLNLMALLGHIATAFL